MRLQRLTLSLPSVMHVTVGWNCISDIRASPGKVALGNPRPPVTLHCPVLSNSHRHDVQRLAQISSDDAAPQMST
jgi:hypothetical protein